MELFREKWQNEDEILYVKIGQNGVLSLNKRRQLRTSYRVRDGEWGGIHVQKGPTEDEEGFEAAGAVLNQYYPVAPETGKRARDLTEQILTDRELLELARECLDFVTKKYPEFIFSDGGFQQERETERRVNDAGLDYSNTDCALTVRLCFRHRDTKESFDGGFDFALRSFDRSVLERMADDYLANFGRIVPLPDELIIDSQYYPYVEQLNRNLDAGEIALNCSLLAGKVGEKVFSEEFTLVDDVSDAECWFTPFWDAEGYVYADDRLTVIEKGVIKTAFSNRWMEQRFHVPHTGSATADYGMNLWRANAAGRNLRIARSPMTVRKLLDGRLCVLPLVVHSSFDNKGGCRAVVSSALLFDGERVLGRVPPFCYTSSLFDMFGKDFIGVGADNPFYHDKQMLFRARLQ